MLLLLDLEDGAILEGPADDVGLLLRLSKLAGLESPPELLEVLDCFCAMSACELLSSRDPSRGGGRDARLMKCQTWLSGALMTALSTTEVEVGMVVLDMMTGCLCFGDIGLGLGMIGVSG